MNRIAKELKQSSMSDSQTSGAASASSDDMEIEDQDSESLEEANDPHFTSNFHEAQHTKNGTDLTIYGAEVVRLGVSPSAAAALHNACLKSYSLITNQDQSLVADKSKIQDASTNTGWKTGMLAHVERNMRTVHSG